MKDLNEIIWLTSCHSTNTYLKEFIKNNDFKNGLTVSAFIQTKGRGQMGNVWESEPYKNLTFSSVYRYSDLKIDGLFILNMVVSLSMIDFMNSIGLRAEIKWPNDIYTGKKKIAGILIEPHLSGENISTAVVGIGLNVNQKNFESVKATSLVNELNQEFNLQDLLHRLVSNLNQRMLNMQDFDSLRTQYYEHLFLKDKVAAFKSGDLIFNGIIRGVDYDGKIVIETDDSEKRFNLKEVQFL